MKNLTLIFTLLVSSVLFSSPPYAEPASERVFTLYRNNHNNPAIRVHVATFDTKNSKEYNKLHCNKAVKYFRSDGLFHFAFKI